MRLLPRPTTLLCLAALGACSGPSVPEPTAEPEGDSVRAASVASVPATETLSVGVAASLRPVLDDLARDFEKRHSGTTVRVESGGSNELCRKALELGASYQILVLADVALFGQLLEPAWTDGHVPLASDRLVLARSVHAKGAERLGLESLGEVLLADGVRLGMADPARAPLGYRTLLAFDLLERHTRKAGLAGALRARVGERFVWPDAAQLLAHLQSGELDYAVLYAASAHEAGLAFGELPPEVNLGSLDHAATYAAASVSIVGLTPGSTLVRKGEPIVYGAALAKGSKSVQATRLMTEILGDRGARALAAHGFAALVEDAGKGAP